MEIQGLHGQVVDRIGQAFAAEEIRAGEILRLEDIQERYGVSRTVAREAVRVLEAKQVVASRPRIGITVRPVDEWNLYDPQVIGWRLGTARREEVLCELAQLRAAVEPAAARLAALSDATEARSQLSATVKAMRKAAIRGDIERFIKADADFHRALLRASGNRMFTQLAKVTEGLLVARHAHSLMPHVIDETAVRRHQQVADEIAAGRSDEAARVMKLIVEAACREVEELLDGGDSAQQVE
ncbi:FCD domain-containing protein [Streptomyces sp. NBC_00424]|uniref:FadR/GntR family transcriptional regulator n=1 Tax=Streptomyces sp. NBC_00424 TaxID=2903648 RepID=UPI002254100E|nr:FCD domain-containing protein [Streptomyces sp. NBC_00424]MCX5078505.1 FCD domain-containing protein [Streptomyces sp. NBC_00424]